MNIVVGSGPSGVAAASALLDAGKPVLMLDIGRELEPERCQSSRYFQYSGHAEAGDDPARKLVFGSSYPYMTDREAGLIQKGTKCLASGGKGGLSAVWGASVLPFPDGEIADWPFPAAALHDHYKKAAAILGIAGAADGLAERFPYYAPPLPPLNPSLQAQSVLARFSSNAKALQGSGFAFGRARHAVNASACRYDGTCLSGCERDAIWSAARVVEALKKRPGFEYRGGVRVLSIEDRPDGLRLHAAREGASRTVYDGEKAFLACGPLATTRLVCGSFGAPAEGLPLLSQPYFVLPLLLDRGVPGAPEERLHTLAQVYLELEDKEVSTHPVHLQVYGHNEVIAERLESAAAWAGPLSGAVVRHFAPRLLAIQGYLHSDEGIPVRITAEGRGEDCRLTVKAADASATKAAVRRVAAKIARHSADLGFTPLSFLRKVGLPGEGNHAGGSFPMKKTPGAWQTDSAGRLHGHERIHLVDSSVLPSIPAATFTYAVMANACRIASEAA
ncbi:MAG: GMC family oxidoreductase [Elusimicrobia bacterium]|nr:GMC family oxidoreductase [Elusimicrobiota bacterium]